jgi:hypothetical protein
MLPPHGSSGDGWIVTGAPSRAQKAAVLVPVLADSSVPAESTGRAADLTGTAGVTMVGAIAETPLAVEQPGTGCRRLLSDLRFPWSAQRSGVKCS